MICGILWKKTFPTCSKFQTISQFCISFICIIGDTHSSICSARGSDEIPGLVSLLQLLRGWLCSPRETQNHQVAFSALHLRWQNFLQQQTWEALTITWFWVKAKRSPGEHQNSWDLWVGTTH